MTDDGAGRIARRFSIAGRRALVTGGSVSIGRAIALVLAEAGADVAIHYSGAADRAFGLTDAALETTAEIRAHGRQAAAIEADFEQKGEARRAVAAAEQALGGVDVLVICASIQQRRPFTQITRAELDRQVRINFSATVEMLQAALPPMKQRGWGRVLTIGSINQLRPDPQLAVYAALKSAQHNLCINLARDYAPFGVTVNNLSPGLVATERNRWRQVQEDWQAVQQRSNPMARAAMPDEMAGAALLLCSDAGSFITGADLLADGGAHL